MKVLIYETLNKLGVPFSTLGRDYIEAAVELILQNGRMHMAKEIYPLIAERFETTPSRAERAIRHAIEKTILNGRLEQIENFFGNVFSFKRGMPTNSEFIYAIAKHIQIYGEKFKK